MSRDDGGAASRGGAKADGAGRYRKLYPRIWTTREFTDLDEGERLVALYLLTGPQSNRVGLFNFSPGKAAEDLKTSAKTFKKRLDRVLESFGWCFDPTERVVWIPSWWKFNPPENPNHLKGMLNDLAEVPDCALRRRFLEHVETLPETLRETFIQTFQKRLAHGTPNQEQEQEQEQERGSLAGKVAPNPSGNHRALPAQSRGVFSGGTLPRDHLDHVACDDSFARCVPRAVHDKLTNRLAPKHGGDRAAASATLLAWYPTVWGTLPADFVMGDAFKFYQGRFDAAFASKDASANTRAPSAGTGVPDAKQTDAYLASLRASPTAAAASVGGGTA